MEFLSAHLWLRNFAKKRWVLSLISYQVTCQVMLFRFFLFYGFREQLTLLLVHFHCLFRGFG